MADHLDAEESLADTIDEREDSAIGDGKEAKHSSKNPRGTYSMLRAGYFALTEHSAYRVGIIKW